MILLISVRVAFREYYNREYDNVAHAAQTLCYCATKVSLVKITLHTDKTKPENEIHLY